HGADTIKCCIEFGFDDVMLRLDLKNTANTDPQHDIIEAELNTALDSVRTVLDADFADHFEDLERVRLFHWAVEFPEAFFDENGEPLDNAGFQVIIGNPPWEIVKPDLREFYAQFDEDIESRLSRKKAEARIKELNAEDPDLEPQWEAQKSYIEAQARYYRATDDYTRQGRGDTATHKLFVERVYDLLCDSGRLGYVVPSGIYTDLGTKDLREMFLNEGSIEYLYGLSNERWFFAGVHHAFHFTVLGVQKDVKRDGFWTVFRYNPRVSIEPSEFPEFIANQDNLIYVKTESIERFSPDSLSIMEFKSQTAYDATKTIYSNVPLMGDEIDNIWNVKLTRELDMTNDRSHFSETKSSIPLYEGKTVHQFDPYFAEPLNWIISESDTSERLEGKNGSGKDYLEPRLALRAIASSTNERTLISSVIPPKVFCGNSLLTVIGGYMSNGEKLFAQSVLNSLALDFVLRNKVTSNINMYILYQLPLPRLTEGNRYFDALVQRAAQLTCTRPEFADLWQQVIGTTWQQPTNTAGKSFSVSADNQGLRDNPQPIIHASARAQIRNEIDALVAHLYGLSRAEFAHILSTFPLVFPDDANGTAKQEALLSEYDTWQAIVSTWSRQ
ncbi:MAG: hypothetical protein AAFV93_06830, partial [Chloroflexota bacterium]